MSAGTLGIDIGLTGVRAAVVRQDGTLAASARRRHQRAHLAEGIAEHDPRDWLEGIAVAGRQAVAGAGDVRIGAIGVAALGPAPLLVDAALAPLTNAPLFSLDRRAELQRRHMTRGLAADQAAATLDNALPKLAWWRDNEPALSARAAWALDATGFVVASLTGVPVMDTVTARDYELPGEQAAFPLPVPTDPLAVGGELAAGAGERLGLPAGLAVVCGTYDSFVDIAAAGVRDPGDAGIVLGSTMIVCRATEAAQPKHGLGVSRYPGHGLLLGGWTLSGGLVLDWFADGMGGGRSQDELAGMAAKVDTGGVVALPYLAGERTPIWDLDARAALLGLGLDSGPEHVYRALIEGLALAVRDHTERIECAVGPSPVWRVTGGGTRNRVWLQATADAVGAPLEVSADAADGVGPGLLALRALGFDPQREPIETIDPDPVSAPRFAAMLASFRALAGAAREPQA